MKTQENHYVKALYLNNFITKKPNTMEKAARIVFIVAIASMFAFAAAANGIITLF